MTPMQSQIIRVFWHNSRREFVPLTAEEISRRAHVGIMEFQGSFRAMKEEGLMNSKRCHDGRTMTYNLTDLAQRIVMGSMAG